MHPLTRYTICFMTFLLLACVPTQAESGDPPVRAESGAPECPTNIHGMALQDVRGVFFSWTLRSATDVKVYKAEGDGEFVFLERLEFPATRHIDQDTEPGQTYRYQVTAIDENGTESEACETVSITTVPFFPSWMSVVGATAIAVASCVAFRRRA